MYSSPNFDYYGHIRVELPDYETELPELFRLPAKRKKKTAKKSQRASKPAKRKMPGKDLRGLG
jgi:hypothetical protein